MSSSQSNQQQQQQLDQSSNTNISNSESTVQGSINSVATTAASTNVVINPENNENNEMSSSIGSSRSLNNSRIFPFRFSRDIILNNVFQEIRPLVQNSSSSNPPFIASWMRSSLQSVNINPPNNEEQQTHSTQDNNNRQNIDTTGDSSSVIINIGSPSTSAYSRQNSAPARTTTESSGDMGTESTNQSRTSLQQPNQSSDPTTNTTSNNNNNNNSTNEDANGTDGNENNLSQIPEARALINTVSRYFPYVCILFAKTCYDHLDGILDIFALFIVFAHSNFTLKQEITKQAQRRYLYLIRELIYIILVVTIIAFLLEKKDNSISLFFAPLNIPPEEKQLALKDLLFSVCITDLILKLVTVAIKILFTMLPRKAVEFKNRGRVYLLIEAISQLYRALVPIQLWLSFLLESYKGTEKVMGVILSAAYIVAKGNDLLQRVKFLKRSFIKFLQKTTFGTVPTKEQVQASGGTCAICHDAYNDPVLLIECNHIFCELCVLGWLDRANSTCPLCRARIDQDNPGFRDGATSFFIQFY